MEYLGELGRLIPLRTASTERVQAEDRYIAAVTVEGRRRVQARGRTPRIWDVSWDLARRDEVSSLLPFSIGGWGRGPWHWVPIQAQTSNMLTPRESVLLDRRDSPYVTDGGPVVDAAGAWSPASVLSVGGSSTWAALYEGVPVVPGVPVTWTADIRGNGTVAPQLAFQFVDASGASVSGSYMAGEPVEGMQRVAFTRVPPPLAVSARVGIGVQTLQMTRPQITWTGTEVPYSTGHGCRAAVIDGVAEGLLLARQDRTYSEVGFTVLEVS